MMGDVWDQFARDVMDSGPFEKLKGNLRGFLSWVDSAKSDGSYHSPGGKHGISHEPWL